MLTLSAIWQNYFIFEVMIMLNGDYDDPCLFNLQVSMWIQRIICEALEHGQDWENPEKCKAAARLLRETSAGNEQYFKDQEKISVLPIKEKKEVR